MKDKSYDDNHRSNDNIVIGEIHNKLDTAEPEFKDILAIDRYHLVHLESCSFISHDQFSLH